MYINYSQEVIFLLSMSKGLLIVYLTHWSDKIFMVMDNNNNNHNNNLRWGIDLWISNSSWEERVESIEKLSKQIH